MSENKGLDKLFSEVIIMEEKLLLLLQEAFVMGNDFNGEDSRKAGWAIANKLIKEMHK